jgi:class 3 adenylate cyclase
MSRDEAIVDITIDPQAARATRRRAMLRIGVPVLGVALMIAVILVIALELNSAIRGGALKLADDVLVTAEARVAERVENYFAIPTRALEEAETIGGNEQPGETRRAVVEKFSIGAMAHVPQIADFIVGDPEGNFMMVRRSDSGGIDTKLIDNTPGSREVIWIRRNASGAEIGRDEDPSDAYDPRTRPWYSGALATTGIFWTDVYPFYTGNAPGITASTRYLSPEGRHFVVGVDITLANLTEFLAKLKVGENGRAIIIDSQGRIVASPRPEGVIKQDASGPTTARVDEIGDAAAAGAYDHFRIDGPGHETITVGRKRYIASLTPLQTVGRDWSIMLVVPENDFLGFIERNNRQALIMSLVIVLLATTGAILLVRQGLRGDRAARLLRDRSQAMTRRTEALARVADEANLFDAQRQNPPEALTETAAEMTAARRTSLWYLSSDGNVLRCADSFDAETALHAGGSELLRSELPHFFEQLAAGRAFEVADAAGDPRTAQVYHLVMSPLGSRSLSVFPVRHQGQVVGAIWLEDAGDVDNARNFLHVIASMASLRAGVDAPRARSAHAGTVPVVAEPDAVHSLAADISLREANPAAMEEGLYREVCVLAIRIGDPSRASRDATELKVTDAIVCAVQKVSAEQRIPYLKVLGRNIVGAAGFGAGDSTATERIAEAALSSRERLAALFDSHGVGIDFRMGIDIRIAAGRPVGSEPSVFNLWGEAVDTAETMAASAMPGAIQTTEIVYSRLRESFLFRPRGAFYVPHIGVSQTYILAGRL